jgi:hypothetical protein
MVVVLVRDQDVVDSVVRIGLCPYTGVDEQRTPVVLESYARMGELGQPHADHDIQCQVRAALCKTARVGEVELSGR